MENYANDTTKGNKEIKETKIEIEKSDKTPRVLMTGDSLLNDINKRGLKR